MIEAGTVQDSQVDIELTKFTMPSTLFTILRPATLPSQYPSLTGTLRFLPLKSWLTCQRHRFRCWFTIRSNASTSNDDSPAKVGSSNYDWPAHLLHLMLTDQPKAFSFAAARYEAIHPLVNITESAARPEVTISLNIAFQLYHTLTKWTNYNILFQYSYIL